MPAAQLRSLGAQICGKTNIGAFPLDTCRGVQELLVFIPSGSRDRRELHPGRFKMTLLPVLFLPVRYLDYMWQITLFEQTTTPESLIELLCDTELNWRHS